MLLLVKAKKAGSKTRRPQAKKTVNGITRREMREGFSGFTHCPLVRLGWTDVSENDEGCEPGNIGMNCGLLAHCAHSRTEAEYNFRDPVAGEEWHFSLDQSRVAA